MSAAASVSLESMMRETARVERFPEGECALCGSFYQTEETMIRSNKITEPITLSICRECREGMEGLTVEEYFQKSMEMNTYTWSKVIAHNFRKLNWISKLAFDILNEGRKNEAQTGQK